MENYFIAINIENELGETIKSKVSDIFNGALVGKFVKKENYHITIKFLGKMTPKKLEEIKEKLSKINFESFNIRIGKLGFFSRQNSGTVWIALKSENLKKFAKNIWESVGWDNRKFMSHLIIMKTKKIFDLKKINNIIKNFRFGNLEFDVNKFYLMKSVSNKDGANYEVIKEYILN